MTIRTVSEKLETGGVRVDLEWTQDNQLLQSMFYSHNISISPQVPLTHIEGRRFQLKVPYDTSNLYNISILGTLQCGQQNLNIFIWLNYSETNLLWYVFD